MRSSDPNNVLIMRELTKFGIERLGVVGLPPMPQSPSLGLIDEDARFQLFLQGVKRERERLGENADIMLSSDVPLCFVDRLRSHFPAALVWPETGRMQVLHVP